MEVLDKLGFDWKVALFNLINFLIVFWILNKFLFSKLGKILEDRQDLISASTENAEKIESELKEARANADAMIGKAKKEAAAILEEGQKKAQEMNEDMRKQTQDQVEQMLSKADHEIDAKKNKMFQDIRKDVSELVLMTTEKVLGKKLDSKSDTEVIENMLEDVKPANKK